MQSNMFKKVVIIKLVEIKNHYWTSLYPHYFCYFNFVFCKQFFEL